MRKQTKKQCIEGLISFVYCLTSEEKYPKIEVIREMAMAHCKELVECKLLTSLPKRSK